MCCGLKLFGINSLNLGKRVSVASVICLGLFGGFLVLHFFPQRSNFDDTCKHEVSSALRGPAGSCSSYFKRLKLPSASHYTVTGEGWKTPESKPTTP